MIRNAEHRLGSEAASIQTCREWRSALRRLKSFQMAADFAEYGRVDWK